MVTAVENAVQPLVDCSKYLTLDQPNAFDALLELLQSAAIERGQLLQAHGDNVQVLQKQQCAQIIDLEQ